MSLLHKTNSVLNFFKPIELLELTDRYNNRSACDYQNINYTSRKESQNININNEKDKSYTDRYNRYKNELSENKIKKTYQIENNISNLSFKKKINMKISDNSKTQEKNQIIKCKEKKLGFMNEKYIKMIEENKKLKEKLTSKESGNKTELEKEIIKIKVENTKLNLLNEENKNKLKEKNEIIEKLKREINNMNIKISELNKENIDLINNINNLKIVIQKLSKDKNILIEEITDLNKNLTNKITPKLTKNENYLLSLEQQLNILKKENDSLIENDIKQKILIKAFQNKNKTSRQNSRKQNTSIVNISQSKSKSTEDLNINNNSTHQTTQKSKILRKKSKSRKNSNSKDKVSKQIKKIKNNYKINKIRNKGKLKKSLSQTNIRNENVLKNKSETNYNLNNRKKKKKLSKNQNDIIINKDDNLSHLLNKKKTKHKVNNTAIIKKNEKDIFKSKNTTFLYKPKPKINEIRIIYEENKDNQLTSTNKKKETTGSLLSSFNEDINIKNLF